MANYEYTGCVTGFSEAGNIQLIQPTQPLYPVSRPNDAYSKRLVSMNILIPTAVQPIVCIPTTLSMKEYNGDIPAPDFSTGHHGKYRINGGDWIEYVGGTSSYDEGFIPEYYVDAFEIFMGSIATVRRVTAIDGGEYEASVPLIATNDMGSALVEVFDDAGNLIVRSFDVPVAFVMRKFPLNLIGSPSDSDDTFDVSTVETTTIEFVPSERAGSIDLVTEMFGGATTAMSCGFAVSQGY